MRTETVIGPMMKALLGYLWRFEWQHVDAVMETWPAVPNLRNQAFHFSSGYRYQGSGRRNPSP